MLFLTKGLLSVPAGRLRNSPVAVATTTRSAFSSPVFEVMSEMVTAPLATWKRVVGAEVPMPTLSDPKAV